MSGAATTPHEPRALARADVPGKRKAAAFFDVDGTLAATTIVHYYVYFRRKRMHPLVGKLWYVAFLIKCVYYLLLDKIDRGRLNIVFYRSYAGLQVTQIKAQVSDCYRDIIKPRRFEEAAGCVARHREAGREVVLVTGSVDFIIEPLAKDLAVDGVVAASLVESNGRFTGELVGPPISGQEKTRRIRQFADVNGIDLSQSHAYGDSIADLPMLELVGFPHAINPDRPLAAMAKARGWPTHHWTIARSSRGL